MHFSAKTLSILEFDKIIKAAQKAIKKIEPDCRIIVG